MTDGIIKFVVFVLLTFAVAMGLLVVARYLAGLSVVFWNIGKRGPRNGKR